MKELSLGVIGMSEGNGHPYSWSAIFNGYNPKFMKDCPFPVIPEYLSRQSFPKDSIPDASITHIWTQEKEISEHISKAAYIPTIVDNYEDMIGKVDAILLARDDPDNHFEMSKPFIEAGLPIFIDKPLTTDKATAGKIFDLQRFNSQVFTCSSLKYAKEFNLSEAQKREIGEIRLIDAIIPKSWEKYGVHIIEPSIGLIPNRGDLISVINSGFGELNIVTVKWQNNITAIFKVLGNIKCPLQINVYGTKGYQNLEFRDSYNAFKTSLEVFIQTIQTRERSISKEQTLEIVEIIEKGKTTYG